MTEAISFIYARKGKGYLYLGINKYLYKTGKRIVVVPPPPPHGLTDWDPQLSLSLKKMIQYFHLKLSHKKHNFFMRDALNFEDREIQGEQYMHANMHFNSEQFHRHNLLKKTIFSRCQQEKARYICF